MTATWMLAAICALATAADAGRSRHQPPTDAAPADTHDATASTDATTQPPAPATTAPATTAPTLDDPVLDDLLARMLAGGLLDAREATLEEVVAVLERGQNEYVRGNALASAIVLWELTHAPRYDNFAELPEMASAWYHLGVALQAYGAHQTAFAAYAHVLARGRAESYFTPALRRSVDIALESKDYVEGLARLDRSLVDASGAPIALDGVDLDEREYLEARALQQQGKHEEALQAYARVGRRSRFHTAALYLTGVVHAERKDWRAAEDAFCKVIDGPNQSTAEFYVDRRYFPVRDLAHLGLGRVAHEERRHEDAFYHYFNVPQDSPELPHALFESAWTMAERGEHAIARGLLEELRTKFPDAPQTVEARVLDGLLMLYDCDFREAEQVFTRFIDDMAPVADHLDEIRKDPDKVRALHRELEGLRRERGGAPGREVASGDLPAHRILLSMLDEDPGYARLSRQADTLRKEAKFVEALDGQLGRVTMRLRNTDTAAARSPEGDALEAIAAADTLERGAAGLEREIRRAEAAGADRAALDPERAELDAIRKEVRALRAQAGRLLLETPPIGSARTGDLVQAIETDRRRLARLRAESLALASDLDDQAVTLAQARLRLVRDRIDDLMGEARMGRIDAVLGAKKKLEIEVQDMAAGRFPPELFGKLQIEGMVGDDEEFWPYEGEYWADEYEGYR